MPQSLPSRAPARHPVFPDITRPSMAKANVRIPDIDWAVRIGRAIALAVATCGWSSKEAAAKVSAACGSEVDDAEFGKWLSGTRRPQLDKLFAVEELREPIVIALGRLVGMEATTSLSSKKVMGA